jgi:replicative DNA helicase
MGKTAFSLNLVQNAALKGDASVAVFSLEMSKEQLVQRMLSSQSNVELSKLKTGKLNENDWPRIIDAMAVLSNAKIHIDDTPGIKISELRSKCRKFKLEHNLGIIMIDYLQLMQGSEKNKENRTQEISDITRTLKMAARELEIPIILLSQLSRKVEERTDHRPMLSDLRESGSIEQDADIVLFIYNPDKYVKDDNLKQGIVDLIIEKHRNGATGTVKLKFISEHTTFTNLNKDGNAESLERSMPSFEGKKSKDLPEIMPIGDSSITDIYS